MENLKAKAFDLRKDVVNMIMEGKGGHIGGDMSVMEILMSLYFCQMNVTPENQDSPDRDRFVLSKGHSVEAYYAVLAAKGFLDIQDVIKKFSKFGSPYIGHPNNKLPGIEMNSGSLGHGLPVCVGMALAGKKDHRDYRVYTVMGDGELAEGSVWEGFMAGHQYKLDNLCAVIDRNRLQISGNTEDVMFMLEHGAMFEPLITEEHEYYRIITSMFLHFGIEHLLNNMVILGALGWNLELETGKIRFLIIYLVSGIGGNLLSLYL